VIKAIIGGATAFALITGPAIAAAPHMSIPDWVVSPTETGCRVELELVGRSGATTPVSLVSDGQLISLRFYKEDLPSRAFLPIRIDRVRYSNLMLRGEDGSGDLVLSAESEAAMRRGAALDIAWLSEEPLSTPLAGSEQGLIDLRTCGAQTATRYRERKEAEQAAKERAEAEARAKALSDAQVAAVRAQAAAAEAQRRQVEAVAERQRRSEAATQRAYYAARQRAYYDAQRQRAYYEAQRRGYNDPSRDDEDDDRWAPPPAWRSYYYRRY
jgi:hypothetical protein